MNELKTLQATFWAMILVQTIGAVDLPREPSKGSPLGGAGTRKMPSPRVYVAAVVLWSLLHLLAETGPERARFASRLSALVLLTGAILGPFGQRAISFLEGVSGRFAVTPIAGEPPPPATEGEPAV